MPLDHLKRLCLALCLASACFHPGYAETEVVHRNNLYLSYGMLTASGRGASASQLGQVAIEYGYSLSRKWMGLAGYNNLITPGDGFRTTIWGFDLGTLYCLLDCSISQESLGDVVSIRKTSGFGLQAGGGISQRVVNVAGVSAGYSGIFLRLQGIYLINEKWRGVLRLQNAQVTSANGTLSLMDVSLGVGLGF